jgi:hypothetical protein
MRRAVTNIVTGGRADINKLKTVDSVFELLRCSFHAKPKEEWRPLTANLEILDWRYFLLQASVDCYRPAQLDYSRKSNNTEATTL